jgi:tetraacyldisaccharide 4'-kinase
MHTIERAVTSVIEAPSAHKIAAAALYGASLLFRAGVSLRSFMYRTSLLPSREAPLPVISIGNIVAGGTGKTPFTAKLARDLAPYRRVAILMRGYRGGDEALMLRDHLDIPIYVDRTRLEAAHIAFQDECDLALLDDGLQHRKLKRDLEIILVDGSDPFGKGHFLPRGYLRESPRALRRADAVVITHFSEEALQAVTPYTDAPIIGMRYKASRRDLAGKRVALLCGIAKPHHFVSLVEELGADIVKKLILPDHIAPTNGQLQALINESLDAGCDEIVCTEKDWVKLPRQLESQVPVTRVPVVLSIAYGEEEYDRLIERAKIV